MGADCGMEDGTAALVASVFSVGRAVGSLAGGYASDVAWRLSPNYGRVSARACLCPMALTIIN